MADAYVQQLDQLRVAVDRLERQAHGQEQKVANASQANGQLTHDVGHLTHEVEVLMPKQRDADQRAAVNTHDIQHITDPVESYAQKLIKSETNLAQVRDERDAESVCAEDEAQKSRAYRDRMVDLENKLAKAASVVPPPAVPTLQSVPPFGGGGISTETAYEKVDWTNPYQAGIGNPTVAPSAASRLLDAIAQRVAAPQAPNTKQNKLQWSAILV